MASKPVYQKPAVPTPSLAKMRKTAAKFGFDDIPEEELKQYQNHVEHLLKGYTVMSQYPEPALPVKYPRTPGYRPSKEENKLNAWYYKTDIQGAPSGILHGKKIAVKDNIPVSGVPMMNGSSLMEGYTPEMDATIVTRVLDAGGCIKGKAVCENLCLSSGNSFTSSTGPLRNPYDETRSAGGSSCGCAVLLAAGEVDMALGADQGGSIRLPACWCGVVGLKPTFGLVPYTGLPVIEPAMDHAGPMARNVKDCALLLEAIAGYDDGLDSRQPRDYKPPKYTEMLTEDLKGMKIGLLKEGFLGSEPDVEATVKKAAEKLIAWGAIVEEVSIPIHSDAPSIVLPVILEGSFFHMFTGGSGIGSRGYYPTSMITAFDRAMKFSANECTPTVRKIMFLAEHVRETVGVKYYAKAMNVMRTLAATYDEALGKYDVIILPTIPFKPLKLPEPDCNVDEYLSAVFANIKNTAAFNGTGHPALTVNAGFSEGLPVGMTIFGKQFDDGVVLKVGHAVECLRDAK